MKIGKNSKKENVHCKRRLNVALIIGEYFGALGTAFGGYGFLARCIIGKMISRYSNIDIEVILGKRKGKTPSAWFVPDEQVVDGINCIRLPRIIFFAKRFFKGKHYDAYLSIEAAVDNFTLEIVAKQGIAPWIFWIQDPRPWYEWREIHTVGMVKETCRWSDRTNNIVRMCASGGGVFFISQAVCLNEKALDNYRLYNDTKIDFVPNPVEFYPLNEDEDAFFKKKENLVVFLGRLDEVKRVWLFCETAKACPEYQFYVVGKTMRTPSQRVLEKYRQGIQNLHFVGHLEGEAKNDILKRAKILINTSIHEALPVSFLEALSFGCLLVSNQNPDELTEKFGVWVGKVSGDGFESVQRFVAAVRTLLADEENFVRMAKEAMRYVRATHAPENVFPHIEDIIRNAILEMQNRKKFHCGSECMC